MRLKARQYQIINNVLFRINCVSVLLRCLEKYETKKVLQELHDGLPGGHFGGNTTAHKILHAGYYWPTLFKDACDYVMKCIVCQTIAGKQRKPTLPLQPINIVQPFE